jgi:hypothetical protein
VWQASDYLCGKRLAPFLDPLVEALERHHELEVPPVLRPRLLAISPATIDRLLQSKRRAHPRGLATTGPSRPALAAQVLVRTFADWQGVRPGALQADLVAHCGESAAGFFLTSLVAVDVATGWTECEAVWGKGYHHVKDAVRWVYKHRPMPVCLPHRQWRRVSQPPLAPRQARIHLTRGRPYRKNDQAYAEQRNWAIIRRLIGYDRYTSRAARVELRSLSAVLRLYWNFFQPLRKLTAKVRHGARVTKRYDRAQTPYQRLLPSGILTGAQRQALAARYEQLNPVALQAKIHDHLTRLWRLADPPAAGREQKGEIALAR